MLGDHCKSQLGPYLTGGLTETQRRKVDDHLAVCERCRQILAKLRSKQAREKREALKQAASGSVPNLFLNRLSRQEGLSSRSSRPWWGWLAVFVLLAGAVYLFYKKENLGLFPKSGEISSAKTAAPSAPEASSISESPSVQNNEGQTVVPSSSTIAPKPDFAALSVPAPAVIPSPAVSSGAVAVSPQVLRQWHGTFCLIKNYREVMITDRDAWQNLWHEMNGEDSKIPYVNFEMREVVGIFLGEKPTTGYGITLLPPKEEAQELVIPYQLTEPAPNTTQSPLLVHPYHLKVIPKTEKKIVFVKGTPP